jgi:hypothetical protein
MLPGGSGIAPPILAQVAWPGTTAFSPASRVSISEMLGVTNLSLGEGRRDARAHHPFTKAPAAAAPCPGLNGRSICGTKHQPSPLPLRAAMADLTDGHIHEVARRRRWEERNAPSIRRPASTHRTARCRAPIAALADPGRRASGDGQAHFMRPANLLRGTTETRSPAFWQGAIIVDQ